MPIDDATKERIEEFFDEAERPTMAMADGEDLLDQLFLYAYGADQDRDEAQVNLDSLEEALGPLKAEMQGVAVQEMKRVCLNVAREMLPPSQGPNPAGTDMAGFLRVLNFLVERVRQTA
ncbi:hypothetical protein LCGC14_0163090 [marine sediment metagenome]|uniref:Uncharacterized protein n=1 Tax=marine sediment metagenome TaxID=412755 RepID=A0A0F9UUA7_9ZZZZ